MMLTCSALRCSVLEGSAISRTSADAGADDLPAPQGIPDTVLYITVDDPTFVDVIGDLEHPTHFPLDAARDVGPRSRGELDLREARGLDRFEQPRALVRLGIPREEAVPGRHDQAPAGSERGPGFELPQAAG